MPAFTSFNPAKKFLFRGVNLNRPIDAIPDGQYSWGKNIRSYEEGIITQRYGLVLVTTLTPVGANDYIHSIYTLNDLDTVIVGQPLRFLGFNNFANGGLWVTDVTFPAAPRNVDNGYSGDPLSMIAASPADSPLPWMYVYDSVRQRKFCSVFTSAPGTPKQIPIGLPIPNGAGTPTTGWLRPVAASLAAGPLTGNYFYRWRWRDPTTGVISTPGCPTWIGSPVVLAAQQPTFNMPPVFDAYGTPYTADLFRFGGAINDWRLVATGIMDGISSITDSLTDSQVNAGLTLDQTRFQPWITQDITRKMTGCTVQVPVAGTGLGDGLGSFITRGAGDFFNPDWLPGTPIIINGTIPATLLRYVDSSHIEVNETLAAIAGTAVVTITGALIEGMPLPQVFGPYGSGFAGLTLFAVGDMHRPGVLYWTNGNDPDSTNPVNSLDITDPSEPLMNGCIWNARVYVWSSQRMWEITPDFGRSGNFVAQIVPGAKGLIARWAFCVGDYIYFWADDGWYQFAGAGLPTPISDADLHELLPHDGQSGVTMFIPNPENFGVPIRLDPPDQNFPETWRMDWHQGELAVRYQESNTGVERVWVRHKVATEEGDVYGWVVDGYNATVSGRTFGYNETQFTPPALNKGGESYLIAIKNKLYQASGSTDDGQNMTMELMTPAYDLDEARAQKLIGDTYIDARPNGNAITARLLGTNNSIQLATGALTASVNRALTILDVAAGLGILDRTVGLWLTWTGATISELYEWTPSWIVKPEVIQRRATDWTDDGNKHSKFLKAVIITANVSVVVTAADLTVDGVNPLKVTSAAHVFVAGDIGSIIQITGGGSFNQGTYLIQAVVAGAATLDHSPGVVGLGAGQYTLSGNRSVQVQYDGGSIAATITLAAAGQTLQPYAIIPPAIGKEFRLLPVDAGSCQIFDVTYVYDEYPDFLPLVDDYTLDRWPGYKYVRGVAIEGDSQGVSTAFTVLVDGAVQVNIPAFVQLGKSLTEIGFASPFLAKEIKLVPTTSWRKMSVRWIFDDYPDFAILTTPWQDGGKSGTKHLRGAIIRFNSNGNPVNPQLQIDGGFASQNFPGLVATGQTELSVAFRPPVPAHNMRWVPDVAWQYFDTTWIFDEYPEYIGIYTPWDNGGTTAPKYCRGVRIKADTLNISISVDVQIDGGVLGINIAAVQHDGQTEKVYPFAVPFLAYMARLVPVGAGSWGFFEAVLIYDEYPDNTTLITSWNNGGTDAPKHIRGVRLKADTTNVSISVQVQVDGAVVAATIAAVQHNGQQEKVYAFAIPFVAYMLRMIPSLAWGFFNAEWIYDEYTDKATLLTAWDDGGTDHIKYIRGGRIEADTGGVPINIQIQSDGGGVAYTIPNVNCNGKQEFPFAVPVPFLAYLTRFLPASAARIFGCKWDADPYPDLTAEITGWNDLGTQKAKYIRAVRVRLDTANAPVNIPIQIDGGVVAATLAAMVGNGQQIVPRALTPPFIAYLLRFAPAGPARIWDQYTEYDFDVYPDLTTEISPVFDINQGSAAFVQGFKLAVDDNGVAARVQVLYDGGQLGPLLTTGGGVAGKELEVFPNALNPFLPFIAHEIQYQPLDPVRGFWTGAAGEVVFEPVPELATVWQTQETDHDLPGYHYMRDCWVAYQSAPGAVGNETLTITTEYGAKAYPLPVNVVYGRVYLTLDPQKAKWRRYKVTSVAGVRLFVRDTVFRVRQWGTDGPWKDVQPFGDLSRTAGARI